MAADRGNLSRKMAAIVHADVTGSNGSTRRLAVSLKASNNTVGRYMKFGAML
jgi:hypothetical protein